MIMEMHKIKDVINIRVLNSFDFWRIKILYCRGYFEISWVSCLKPYTYKPFLVVGE